MYYSSTPRLSFDMSALQAFQPLLQAVHDLAVCTAAGLPPGCGGSLRLFKRQLQQESLEGHLLPPEGMSSYGDSGLRHYVVFPLPLRPAQQLPASGLLEQSSVGQEYLDLQVAQSS